MREAVPSTGHVELWEIDLGAPAPADCAAQLADNELRRAGRFVSARDRNRYLNGRHALRRILAAYLGVAPATVPLRTNEHEKPLLPPECGLSFNLSHCGDRAILAVGRVDAIGVDLERAILPADARALAGTVFSEDELAVLEALGQAEFASAFFVCWTRKEACLKALGVGFSVDPRSLSVGIEPGRRRVTAGSAGASSRLQVESTIGDAGWVWSLAVRGGYSRVSRRTYPGAAGALAA